MQNISIFPRTQAEEFCPACMFPLAGTAHGWVKEYRKHEHTEKCHQYYGYCLVPCPMCTGGVEAKRQAQLINELFRDSNIPHYAREWTFDSYPNDANQGAMRQVRARLNDWLKGTPTRGALYLVGDNGECKTSLAISALHAWLRKGHSGCFILAADLFSRLKDAIAASKRNAEYLDRYEASQGAKLLRLVKSVELLILDDLGVECGSSYEIRELYLILEARRSHGLYTIFTSNCDAAGLTQHWKNENVVYQDAQRIIDRLGEYAFVVPAQGRNQRQK